MLQIAAVGPISVGIVLVLLLGEIDLSVGAVSGLAAAVMAVLNVQHGWAAYLAIVAAIARRRRDRPPPGLAVHPLRRPVVRRHPRRPARLAGGPAYRCSATTGTHQHHRPRRSSTSPNTFSRDTSAGSSPIVDHRRLRWRRSASAIAGGSRPGCAIGRVRVRSCASSALAVVVIGARRDPQLRPRRAAGGHDPARRSWSAGVSSPRAPASAATSSPSAATPRRRGGPASDVNRVRITVFMLCRHDGGDRRRPGGLAPARRSTRPRAAATCCCSRSPAR